jgi:RAB protein geranylgeranyltransferase component A
MDRNDYYGGESSSLNLTKVNLADTYIYYTVIDRSIDGSTHF